MPMNKNFIEVKIRELLEFFDEAPKESKKHATSVVAVAEEELGIALLIRYLKQQGKPAEIIGDRCTQGTNKGYRLDAWVGTGTDNVLYQVEVKNWSAHAIGGKELAINATPEMCTNYRKKMWKAQWDGSGFTNPSVNKVLEKK